MIQINYRDSRPIYEQIKDGIRKLIVQGIMESNEKLPSVRELATSLTKGKGCFVAGIPEENSARKSELLKQVADISEELKFMGTKKEDVFAVIDKVWNSK